MKNYSVAHLTIMFTYNLCDCIRYTSSAIIKQHEQNLLIEEVYFGLWIQMRDSLSRWISITASSRHVFQKKETKSLSPHSQAKKQREKSGNGVSLKLSRPTYSGMILSARLHLLNLHKVHNQLENKVCKA